MKQIPGCYGFTGWGLVGAVLLSVFIANTAWCDVTAGAQDVTPVAEEAATAAADPADAELLTLIENALSTGSSVEALTAELLAKGVAEKDIICGLFNTGVEHLRVIVIALNSGMNPTQVHEWAEDCGANLAEVQVGYSMAGLPIIFQAADELSNSNEYIYNPPSPSQ